VFCLLFQPVSPNNPDRAGTMTFLHQLKHHVPTIPAANLTIINKEGLESRHRIDQQMYKANTQQDGKT